VALVFHGTHLRPLIFFHYVLLDRVKSLFARETTQDEHVALAHGNCVGVATLVHLAFIRDLVFNRQVQPGVFFGRGAASSDENLVGREGDGCGALVEFGGVSVIKFLEVPFVFVYVVT